MTRHVVATAGHVDHGKSTLIRALTGIETDRWAEERRRGLTIDLGFAWTALPSGRHVAFIDVPGHERFVANMLAGLGGATSVLFVVAADEGWSAQSDDHRDALRALGVERGVIAVTRCDRAPEEVEATSARARAELADTGLAEAPVVAVSGVNGAGLESLRAALDDMLATEPEPDPAARVRFWVDRSFTITGAGTVVTGTLLAGSIARGDELHLATADGLRSVTVRSIESEGARLEQIGPVVRTGLNLRGISAEEAHRGDLLLTPGAWNLTDTVDVRKVAGAAENVPEQVLGHVGSASIPLHARQFDADHLRLRLPRALPLVRGDRLVLRDPGRQGILAGVQVLDADPPELTRRGDASRRSVALAAATLSGTVHDEVARRGAVSLAHLRRLGLVDGAEEVPAGVRTVGEWWVQESTFAGWAREALAAVRADHERNPLSHGISRGSLVDRIGLPSPDLLSAVAREAGLDQDAGRVRLPGRPDDLGPAEPGIATLEVRLSSDPFDAPLADDLIELGLGVSDLAAAERAGRVLRLGEVVLLPSAPAQAMRELAALEQPFTTSQARQTLNTSRRVAIPLLEHLDRRGWTRRLDAGHREVVR
ncbi:selenocysteine-specific translation elongation factor [Demetria terragena]|uniref:selenocysteine-specific translation elongation factor n=1 Tax=Demetria terragena TaxID=63959 RepID=UPI00036B1C17|nr:selenocysteine-specific translation elongation factor [Demetria terragena]